jgi:hypothetical protein
MRDHGHHLVGNNKRQRRAAGRLWDHIEQSKWRMLRTLLKLSALVAGSWNLSWCLSPARPPAGRTAERASLVFRLRRQHARQRLLRVARDASSRVAPCSRADTGFASISMGVPGAELRLPTCSRIRERRSGTSSTGSHAATSSDWMPPRACHGGVIARYGWRRRTPAASGCRGNLHRARYRNDRRPSLRYLTLLRDGARAHGLPEHYTRFLEQIEHAR